VVDFSGACVTSIGNALASYRFQEVAVKKYWIGGVLECWSDAETVKTVGSVCVSSITPLKRGVNERSVSSLFK
jgi:hypothetical protein